MTAVTTPVGTVKVVAVLLEGDRKVRGIVQGFSPRRDRCTIFPADHQPGQKGTDVKLDDLKVIYFVKEFANEAVHNQTHNVEFVGPTHGRKMEVTFIDGHKLVGTTEGYSPNRIGFFMNPPDPGGNNHRIFIVNSSVGSVRWL